MKYSLKSLKTKQANDFFWSFILGTGCGLPSALTFTYIQYILTINKATYTKIGAISLIAIPFCIKPFWAPILDILKVSKNKRFSWVILRFIITCCMYFISIRICKTHNLNQDLILVLALLCIFSCANLDIAVDAYRITTINSPDVHDASSSYVSGYRLGSAAGGGISILIASYYNWLVVYDITIISLLIIIGIFYFFAPRDNQHDYQTTKIDWREAWLNTIKIKNLSLLAPWLIFYRLTDGLVGNFTLTILVNKLNIQPATAGMWFKTYGIIASLIGAHMASIITKKRGIYSTSVLFLVGQIIITIPFMFLVTFPEKYIWIPALIFFENIVYGGATAVVIIVIMQNCSKAHAASQVAILTALSSLGRAISGPLIACFADIFGLTQYYIVAMIIGIIALKFNNKLHKERSVVCYR